MIRPRSTGKFINLMGTEVVLSDRSLYEIKLDSFVLVNAITIIVTTTDLSVFVS